VIARCVRWLGFPFLVAAFPHHTTRRPRGGERRRLVRSVPSVPREPEPERMSWWWWQGRGGIGMVGVAFYYVQLVYFRLCAM
jgi:hypothetical protein